VPSGMERYPDGIDEELASRAPAAHMLDALTLANEAGHARAVNTVMLGAFSNYLDFREDEWRRAIEGRVPPKTVGINLRAFELGRKAGAR
jgi:indolepyruvate ferredoxin oxidoreductase beta subunit